MKERVIIQDEQARAGPRERPARVLTLVEFLYRNGVIDFDEYDAAGRLRNMHFVLMPPSEGVSSYGLSPGGSNPERKGDRKAQRLTGISIQSNGSYTRGPSYNNRSERWKYSDALVAMVGVTTDEGEKVVDTQAMRLMLRAITESETMPTQLEIGQARTAYKSGKQVSAVGASFVKECLRRLALHFKLVKGEQVK